MYAITFDLVVADLKKYYGNPYNNAYAEIRKLLSTHGFYWVQGSVYFGDDSVNAVTCVVAVQQLTKTYPWFSNCVKDIRMLRIEENNDLMPAVNSVKP